MSGVWQKCVRSVCVAGAECVWCSHKNKGGTWSCQLVKRSFLPSIRAGPKTKSAFWKSQQNEKMRKLWLKEWCLYKCVLCVCDSISSGASTSWLHSNQNQKPQNIKCLARNEPNLICNYYCLTRSISRHLSQLTHTTHTHLTHTHTPSKLLLFMLEAHCERQRKIFKYLRIFISISRATHNCCFCRIMLEVREA